MNVKTAYNHNWKIGETVYGIIHYKKFKYGHDVIVPVEERPLKVISVHRTGDINNGFLTVGFEFELGHLMSDTTIIIHRYLKKNGYHYKVRQGNRYKRTDVILHKFFNRNNAEKQWKHEYIEYNKLIDSYKNV